MKRAFIVFVLALAQSYSSPLFGQEIIRGQKSELKPDPSMPIRSSLININEAGVAELMTLPGVGEKRAQAIIDYRKRHRFLTLGQLVRVKGIGPKRMAQIRDKISIR